VLLLIDENVPASVAALFAERGHEVRLVVDLFPAGSPDPVIAAMGDRMAAIVVTWDRDFDQLVRRIPKGNRGLFRRLGRISFRCNEAQGRRLLERWNQMIEYHHDRAWRDQNFRMIVQIQDSGAKFM